MDIGRAVIKAKQMGVTFNRVIPQPSQRALIEFRAPPTIPRVRECIRVRKIVYTLCTLSRSYYHARYALLRLQKSARFVLR